MWPFSSLLAIVAVASAITNPGAVRADSGDVATIQVDAAAVQNDRRLEKPVSVSTQALSLKSLLDQISAQSSVDIRIDERDPASSYAVLAECVNVPTSKIMDALYSLVSIRKGEWAWMRSGMPGAYRYSLHETPWAKDRIEIYNRILDGLLTNYLKVLRDLAPMKMEERKLHRDALKRALFLDKDAYVNFYFENEIFWTEAKFFLGALTPAQQTGVLRGGGASIALKDLAPDVYDLFHQAYLHTNRRRKNDAGTIVPVPEPETVSLYRRQPGVGSQSFAPAILISLGNMDMTWMGTGSLEAGVRSAIEQAWMLPGDSADDAAGKSTIMQMKENEEARLEREKVAAERELLSQHLPPQAPGDLKSKILRSAKYYLSLDTALGQLATGSSTPVLAILPTSAYRGFETPVGQTVSQYLLTVEGTRKLFFHKWRDGVLLINHPRWLTEASSPIPYRLLSSLQPDKFGRVTIAEWVALMSKISDDQSDWLAETHGITNMRQSRAILLLTATYPGTISKNGDVIDAEEISYLRSVSLTPRNVSSLPPEPRLRVRRSNGSASSHGADRLQVQVYEPRSQNWLDLETVTLPVLRQERMRELTVP